MLSNRIKSNYMPLFRDMKFIVLCLFMFFLGYEYWDGAYIFGGFTITRTLGILYFIFSIVFFKKSFSINYINKNQLFYIFIFSWILILSNLHAHLIYTSELNFSSIIFNLQFFIFYWIVGNEVKKSLYKKKLLFVFFILGILSIYILMINGIGLQTSNQGDSLDSLEGVTRLWFMGMNPNTLGSLTALASILLVYLSLNSDFSYFKKMILLLLLIPFIHMIFLTGSLGSFLSLLIGVVTLLLLDKRIIFSKNAFLILIAFVLLYFIVNRIDSNFLLDKLDGFLSTGNTSGRTEIWIHNYNAAVDSFMLGLGLDTGLRPSHNVFLDVFIWTGILGLLTYTLFILSIFRVSILNVLKYNSSLELAILLVLLLVLFKSGGGFQIKYIWLFLAIISVPSENRNINHVT